ncbi:UDP-2,4-diacetamido-2,4,6-trideoxy-beta-L-altropyranose hydrolase [Flaviaesturariibacter flavus]|uniref:UDP-2,4-diacetamido-2,4, 6-trideoxy-beta-L-altropyranose hydrolase n=1 Tax=Flaviaesturariibacter flavus TaxID=2502780 RepID=A0A4R1BB04_9BACT|nr:UDP-2,4-diacetamido-2,4,6-trideoxy-beta-L-altropyranose hydrolase [Flaviaesturariibacter flavus]TCJ14176.1 UDP-2,4-diacetamido-2,4,6-trideoxy-beta-L-altropyranose hydrolase [Flaviaesturariibacter flavus]
MNKPTIVFRADGSSSMGLGHLFRSAALADMLQEDFQRILVTRCDQEPVLRNLATCFDRIEVQAPGTPAEDALQLAALATGDAMVVLDGYHFDTDYQQHLVDRQVSFACIDDIHAYRFLAATVINHSGGFTPLDYEAEPTTTFYLGPAYALLRAPFLEAAKTRRQTITDNSCIICFGGADPRNTTLEVLRGAALAAAGFDHMHVVVGAAYPFREELEAFAGARADISLHYSLTPDAMAALMQRCSYAICSPSTVVYEYLSVGGVAFLATTADNQTDVYRYFVGEGLAFPLEKLGKLSDDEISDSLAAGARIFDGGSAARYSKLFRQHFDVRELQVRRANEGDVKTCFDWSNDPEVRQQSYNQAPIPYEDHTRWFAQKLQDPACFFYIFERHGEPVAQIRFQVSGSEAVLGYLAAPGIRSRGLGAALLAAGIGALINDYRRPLRVVGFVKKSNIASQRSFERLAFVKEDTEQYPDSIKYTLNYGI